MTSEKQIQANIENAKLGGVKTQEGKEVSRLNAIKHGILSSALSKEESNEITELYEGLIKECQPQNQVEELLVERITMWTIRLRRAVKAETEQWLKVHNPRITKSVLDDFINSQEEVTKEGYKPRVTDRDIRLLEDTYLRYESAIERNLYKALHELQRIQATRNGEKPPLPLAIDVNIDGEKDINRG
ncbi:MAG: hypothetical protein Q7R97_00265 [Candidatus Daviesbacteria bacterium]|nr:hypothetical protein [Candidatus Daviesbacteria bacterium]